MSTFRALRSLTSSITRLTSTTSTFRTTTLFTRSFGGKKAGDDAESTFTQANRLIGRQQLELEMEQAGVGGFRDQPAMGPFGTIHKPVLIFSNFKSRIVGCKGGDHHEHETEFFILNEGHVHLCPDCGQAFKLIASPNSESYDPTHTHDDHHDEHH